MQILRVDGRISRVDEWVSRVGGRILRVDEQFSRVDGWILREDGQFWRVDGRISGAEVSVLTLGPELRKLRDRSCY